MAADTNFSESSLKEKELLQKSITSRASSRKLGQHPILTKKGTKNFPHSISILSALH